jgi:hypothetical protein
LRRFMKGTYENISNVRRKSKQDWFTAALSESLHGARSQAQFPIANAYARANCQTDRSWESQCMSCINCSAPPSLTYPDPAVPQLQSVLPSHLPHPGPGPGKGKGAASPRNHRQTQSVQSCITHFVRPTAVPFTAVAGSSRAAASLVADGRFRHGETRPNSRSPGEFRD